MFVLFHILENKTIFLVGPTVVSPSGTIHFKAMYPQSVKTKLEEAKLFNSVSSTAIDFNASGYDLKTCIGESIFQRVEMPYDEENKGVYKISVNNTDSNSLDVSLGSMLF